VVVGDEDVVADRADRFGLAAAAADLPVVGGERLVVDVDDGAARAVADAEAGVVSAA
jgi:hypothetical protein